MYTPIVDIKKTAAELESMLSQAVINTGLFIPVSKTSIRYKNYLISRQKDNSWNIYTKNQLIASTFLKISAFAVCTMHEKKMLARVREVLLDDKLFEKNYIDSIFFKRTFKSTRDDITKDTAFWRYEIVNFTARVSKERIDKAFYSLIK
jgi:hypothetical protein